GLALRGCLVTGVDLAAPILDQARRLDAEAGVRLDYRVARAEETGLPGQAFDVVTAGQCWHWFDRPAAGRQAGGLLVPGGRLVIAHFDWIPSPGNVVDATEELITAFNPAQRNPQLLFSSGSGLYGPWLADAAGAGFAALETFSFDVDV